MGWTSSATRRESIGNQRWSAGGSRTRGGAIIPRPRNGRSMTRMPAPTRRTVHLSQDTQSTREARADDAPLKPRNAGCNEANHLLHKTAAIGGSLPAPVYKAVQRTKKKKCFLLFFPGALARRHLLQNGLQNGALQMDVFSRNFSSFRGLRRDQQVSREIKVPSERFEK